MLRIRLPGSGYQCLPYVQGLSPCKVRSIYLDTPKRPLTFGHSRMVIRCPHVRDVCRNRSNHPRLDVLYLKNAEGELSEIRHSSEFPLIPIFLSVDSFNGCGYCKVRGYLYHRKLPDKLSASFSAVGPHKSTLEVRRISQSRLAGVLPHTYPQ